MAILNQPQGNRDQFEFIRSFRPSGSDTVVWVQDMKRGTLLHPLRWGGNIYLPVYEGLRLGIGLYNGRHLYKGYPVYIEAANLWIGGPSEPELCSPDYMWEVEPLGTLVMDALKNPDSQNGRPLVVVPSGQGLGIGEASFGTTMYRGQIRVYERLPLGGGYQASRPTNAGSGQPAGGLESYGGGELRSLGLHPTGRGGDTKGPAAIGADEEELRRHRNTGVRYQSNAQPVVFFRAEYRYDLFEMLAGRWGRSWEWDEPMPVGYQWWTQPWTWRPGGGTVAPHIPTPPHKGR